MPQSVMIGNRTVGDGYPCFVVGELGINHQGDLGIAKRLIDVAAEAGCDAVKTQKRTPKLSVPESEWRDLRDTPWGKMTKIDYRNRVEFTLEQHTILTEYARRIGLGYFVSVWDNQSVLEMIGIEHRTLKIPSARATDYNLLWDVGKLAHTVILSTGGCSFDDVRRAVAILLEAGGKSLGICLLQCVMAYPARADESNLRVIQTYKRAFGCPVGFSSHKIGQETVRLSVAAGANMIERHLTLDRKLRGSDHRMSTEPHELARLVREIREVEAIMGSGEKVVLPSEIPEAKRLGRGK